MDFIPVAQTVLGVLISGGLAFLIKRAVSTQAEIAKTKEELKSNMQEGFEKLDKKVVELDKKVGRLDQWAHDHEKIDAEQQKRADERYGRITNTLDRLTA